MTDRVTQVAEGVRRVVAPNPSPFTQQGTNSYVLGRGRVAVVDPGPALAAHQAALLGALEPGERVVAILVTHPHRDHSGLAPSLSRATGAPVFAAGGATERRSPAMAALARSGLAGGGEGLDHDFAPDHRLTGGEALWNSSWRIRVIETPGHMATHLAFAMDDVVFSGDHVMGWSTSIVSPPDGDMGAYMASLDRLARQAPRLLLPGHGPEVTDPAARIAELAAHRRAREAAILAALGPDPRTAADLARAVYTDTPPALLPAASRNVLAHLLDLAARGLASADGEPAEHTGFRRT